MSLQIWECRKEHRDRFADLKFILASNLMLCQLQELARPLGNYHRDERSPDGLFKASHNLEHFLPRSAQNVEI